MEGVANAALDGVEDLVESAGSKVKEMMHNAADNAEAAMEMMKHPETALIGLMDSEERPRAEGELRGPGRVAASVAPTPHSKGRFWGPKACFWDGSRQRDLVGTGRFGAATGVCCARVREGEGERR